MVEHMPSFSMGKIMDFFSFHRPALCGVDPHKGGKSEII